MKFLGLFLLTVTNVRGWTLGCGNTCEANISDMQYVIDDSSGPSAGTCYGMGTTYTYCKFESNANDALDTVDVYESCDLGISENHATLNNAYSGCALATGEWEWGSFILS